jgi:hypothetical protein
LIAYPEGIPADICLHFERLALDLVRKGFSAIRPTRSCIKSAGTGRYSVDQGSTGARALSVRRVLVGLSSA